MSTQQALTDYYQVLGVPHDADAETIKKQYRHLVREFHPDLATDKSAAHEKFVTIVDAYQTLIDPIRRAMYDSMLLGTQRPEAPTRPNTQTPKHPNTQTIPAQPFSFREAKRKGESIITLIEAEQWFIRGEHKKAAELCKQVLEKEPKNAQAYFLVGEIFESLGKIDRAFTFYSYAVQFAPHVPHYQRRLDLLLERDRKEQVKKQETVRVPSFIDSKSAGELAAERIGIAFRLVCLGVPLLVSAVCLYVFKQFPGAPLIEHLNTPLNAFWLPPLCGFAFGLFLRLGRFVKSIDRTLFSDDPFLGERHLPSILISLFVSFGLALLFARSSDAFAFVFFAGGVLTLLAFFIGWALAGLGTSQQWWE